MKKLLLKLDTLVPAIYAKSITEFNSYVDKYQPLAESEIILTKSGNISQANLRNMPCARTWKRDNKIEFHYIDSKEHIRIVYSLHYDENGEFGNTERYVALDALSYFRGLMDVIPTNNKETFEPIISCPENPVPKYYNYCNEQYTNIVIPNTYSLDRNSSFLASLVTIYPKAKPWIDKYQEDKLRIKAIPKENRTQKDIEILSYDKIFIGWLNNPKYNRSNAWNKIINHSNKVIHELRMTIEAAGHTVLVVNTDAVKFIGKFDYNTSTDLGGFKYEWQNAKIYIKSVKSYAYNESGIWQVKQAGKCKLDNIKPRSQWTLDDFKSLDTFNCSTIKIKNGKLVEEYEQNI